MNLSALKSASPEMLIDAFAGCAGAVGVLSHSPDAKMKDLAKVRSDLDQIRTELLSRLNSQETKTNGHKKRIVSP